MKYLVLIFVLYTGNTWGQVREASLHLLNNEPHKAEEILKPHLEAYPSDSAALFLMGRVSLLNKDWNAAAAYFEKAAHFHYPEAEIHYYQARRILAESGSATMALDELKAGASNGMIHFIPLTKDHLFDPLRNTSGWESLMKTVEKNTYPCLNDDTYRHFDFWLGTWDVYVNDIKRGENHVTRANGGCAIHESYTTYPRDYTGQSINFYDPRDKLWHQHWVGSGGDVTNYLETDKGPGMLEFTGFSLDAAGNTIINQLTFTLQENGDVRQLIKTSSDNQETWSVSFDGLYKRKDQP